MPQVQFPRNIFVYDVNFPQGTNPTLVAVFTNLPQASNFRLIGADGVILPRDDAVVTIGDYYVVSLNDPTTYVSVVLTPENARPRIISGGSPGTGAVTMFRERVRERDEVCVVSRMDSRPWYYGQNTCHIIPRSHFSFWSNNKKVQYLTAAEKMYGIDSVQNGLVLDSTLHTFWDMRVMSINPMTMRVTFFWSNGFHQQMYDRRLVQFNSTPELPAPPQALIYEHFRQAVLANMKGAGQRRNFDFDPTEDAQNMSVFESGEGKEWLETVLVDKLCPNSQDNVRT